MSDEHYLREYNLALEKEYVDMLDNIHRIYGIIEKSAFRFEDDFVEVRKIIENIER